MDLNADWNIKSGEDEIHCDLPYDATVNSPRDFSCAFGELNGYIPAARAVFTKVLPHVKSGANAALVLSGICGAGAVYVNDDKIISVRGYSPVCFDISDKLTGVRDELRIDLFAAPGMSDKYTGLGIAGGVKLVTFDDIDISYNSLFVKTVTVGDKTYADAELNVVNRSDDAVKLTVDCTAVNARGKRAGKKQRKLCIRAGQDRTVSVRVRINKAYEWMPADPYMYTMIAKIVLPDGKEREASARFGLVTRSLNPTRGLYINGKNTLLYGAYISHADAALGGVCNYSNEVRRFNALKAVGYNAVHFVGCPAEAALDACDDTGMYAFVDLFDCLNEGKAPLDVHASEPWLAEDYVRAIRNHPSVTVYGVADDVPECYGRHGGYDIINEVAQFIRGADTTRPVTVSVGELVPTPRELESVGIKRRKFETDSEAVYAAREKSLFEEATAVAFEAVDVCGFNYLYPLYSAEKKKRDRLIVGARTSSARAFESIDETEKNGRVIGDFNDCGIDYPGGGKLNEIVHTGGDLDALCDEKPQSVYKRILFGARNIAYITVLDPETDEPTHMWNWPRHLGREVKVQVFTSGDVVALYLDGRLVGRRLAGRINKHIATFELEYYPGVLEAVSYYKGYECARATLKSAGSPKAVKLSAYDKNLYIDRGDLGFVHADVCDRDGLVVPYAMRELTATVAGGRLIAFINADPMLRKNSFDTCPAYGGKAMAVIKPDADADRTVVKISGDGLLSAKITFKIK